MSRIYFHSEAGEVEVRGPERHYAGGVCSDLLSGALRITHYCTEEDIAAYLTLFPADSYLQRLTGGTEQRRKSIETAMAVDPQFFVASLNTALVMGSDEVKLLARMHGSCEIHGYVEGPDRAWLADLVGRGRATKILRADMGWEALAIFLRSDSTAPVVTSYSVCEQFPNAHVAGWTNDDDGEGWEALPQSERWSRAFAALDPLLRLDPATWNSFYFGDGVTAFDLLEQVHAARKIPTDDGAPSFSVSRR